jgi:Holliday junction resolvase-like predicted endonuclease
VDVVVSRGQHLYFVEVRTRGRTSGPIPEQSLTPRKLSRMEKVARIYLGRRHLAPSLNWHLSFAAVVLDQHDQVSRISFYPSVESEPIDLVGAL